MNHVSCYTGSLFDPFFDNFFDDEVALPTYSKLDLRTDIKEEGDDYLFEIEVPGFKKENIALNLKDGYLTVTASCGNENKEKKEKHHYLSRERYYATTSRTYYVGEVEEKDINANYQDGILTIRFPKNAVEKAKKAQSIEIH